MSRNHKGRGALAHGQRWYRIRRAVLDRDGWKCSECGRRGRLEVHHVKAIADGGSNDLENLRSLCLDCHIAIHSPPVSTEAAAWQQLLANL